MYTINDLREQLGLLTAHQVRNRIDAIRSILTEHLRRGPNNQLLVSPEGLDALRRLQELHEGGLTLSEASAVMRDYAYKDDATSTPVSCKTRRNSTTAPVQAIADAPQRTELASLKERIARLESRAEQRNAPVPGNANVAHNAELRWWLLLQEESDGF